MFLFKAEAEEVKWKPHTVNKATTNANRLRFPKARSFAGAVGAQLP